MKNEPCPDLTVPYLWGFITILNGKEFEWALFIRVEDKWILKDKGKQKEDKIFGPSYTHDQRFTIKCNGCVEYNFISKLDCETQAYQASDSETNPNENTN